MNAARGIVLLVVGALLLIVLFLSTYIVYEPEQVVITEFGKPVGDVVDTPGL